MNKRLQLNPYSFSSYFLQVLCAPDGVAPYSMGHATGFIWKRDKEYFLITNWHVVSGKNYENGCLLDSNGAIPNALIISSIILESSSTEKNVPFVNLYRDDQPAWFEHPSHGKAVDVVAVRIEGIEGCTLHPINEIKQQEDMKAVVGQDCFIIGYPLGKTPFPIWKNGNIASDPELLDIPGINSFYVDTATRSGMSGSPSILLSRATYLNNKNELIECRSNGYLGSSKLLGIYSSRVPSDASAMQLGVVFPVKLIEELINSIPIKTEV